MPTLGAWCKAPLWERSSRLRRPTARRSPAVVVRDGLLSLAQMETVVYAGQAHSEQLPGGERKGYFVGDGTGVGKGREISGVILENLAHGRSKAVWISCSEGLIEDARRDFAAVGGDPDLLFSQGRIKTANVIARERGILFTTYAILRSGQKKQASDLGRSAGKTRLQQTVDWLGNDFDGVIAFDEAHSMGNAIAMKGKRGTKKPAQQAIAGLNLQREVPDARVLYVSATGATEVSNLTYAERLRSVGGGHCLRGRQGVHRPGVRWRHRRDGAGRARHEGVGRVFGPLPVL